MRYRLRTLLVALALGPPLIASVWFDWADFVLAVVYFGTLAAILPVAAYLWRNSTPL